MARKRESLHQKTFFVEIYLIYLQSWQERGLASAWNFSAFQTTFAETVVTKQHEMLSVY